MKKPLRLIRDISRVFFPAFSTGIGFCFVQMIVSDRPIMSAGLMLLCIGMALMCANVEVWASAKLKGENKNGRNNQSNRKAA